MIWLLASLVGIVLVAFGIVAAVDKLVAVRKARHRAASRRSR